MTERPLLKIVAAKDHSQDNAVGIKHVKAIVADLLNAPRRGKSTVLVA